MREALRAGSLSISMAKDRRMCAALKLNEDLFTFMATKMRVPLQMIFQLRCVCKTWDAFLADHYVVTCLLQQLSQTPRYIVSFAETFAAFDTEIQCWHRWSSAFHSKHFHHYDVCGDAGGWFLMKKKGSLPYLFLANPTKRAFRKLPIIPEERAWLPSEIPRNLEWIALDLTGKRNWIPDAMGVGLGESSKACKVFGVDQLDIYSYKVHLYDFELNSWKAFGHWQRNDGETILDYTFFEGALYSTIITIHGRRRITKVCRLDERKSCWQELPAQMPEVDFANLFQWQGHLMLIGARKGGQNHGCRFDSFHIWQLDEKNHVWVESTRMPDHIVDHLHASEIDVHTCSVSLATCDGQVCLTSTIESSICESRHVWCDLSKPLWWDMPEPSSFYLENCTFSLLIPKLECETL